MKEHIKTGYSGNGWNHYDSNLDCNPPPFYPAIEFDDGSGEIQIKMSSYSSIL